MFAQSRVIRTILSIILLISLLISSYPTYAAVSSRQQPEINQISAANQAGSDVFLPIISNDQMVDVGGTSEWATVGANPQRTSVTVEQVSGSLKVSWYRPIDAYIPQNVQLIAANGLIFVATARGLYALNAATGSVAWRFDTEMPIGNSPAVSDGTVYVAGYDRKLHALEASTGVQRWEFDDANAGFESSPLVVEDMVILGNRDGNLYAVGAQGNARAGQLIWKYQTGGPIHMTPAYKNGVVYVGSGDMYAYAVTTSGALKWKSSKLPGDGFQSYWPVVFTDPTTHQDLVVFSGASGYRWDSAPGDRSMANAEIEDIFFGKSTSPDTPIATSVAVNEAWAAGKTVLDYSSVAEYYENSSQASTHFHKPWRRSYFVLNTSNGTEYTYDSDHDGYAEYAPIIPFGTGSGNAYPPVVGKDGLLYFSNLWLRNGQGRIMGWRVGTPYMVLGKLQGDAAEPQAISGGGNLIYRSICCDRVGDWYDTTNPDITGLAWHYSKALTDQTPGYDEKWWFVDPNFLDRLTGNYGNVNGIYNNHGDQNPIIPYKGRLYIHRSNAVIAFGPTAGPGKLSIVPTNVVTRSETTPARADLQSRLTSEVSKMIAAGHLRPGYYNAGQFSTYAEFISYFENPGDTLYTLARAFPYITPTVQEQLKGYLKTEFGLYFDPVMYSNIGWADGAAREASALPPEVEADMDNYTKRTGAGPAWTWQYPQYNFYGMWKYAVIFPGDALKVYGLALGKLQVPLPAAATAEHFNLHPWELNGYIGGYIGFLNLQKLAGRDVADAAVRTQVTNELNRLQSIRASTFAKDTPYITINQGYQNRTLTVARNFIMLVPELGDYLYNNSSARSKVQAALNEYNSVGPYWFVSRYNGSIGESAMQNLYDYNAMFQAYAYIMKMPYDQLTKYLDAPAFEKGDLFYIQNLIAVLEAP